ncbi:MAG: PEGA domain-containing protein [Methanoregula sp.]
MKKLILVLFVCIAMIGCVLAAVPSVNLTVTTTATTAPQLIGGSMGTYLVQANVNGANVSFDSDYKGVITNGTLAVSVYSTGTPYRTISVQAPGYALYTANITQVPGNQETIDIPVTLIPATQPTVPASETTTAAASPAPTTSGSLPFAVFGAFVIVGIFAIRSRR